MARIFTVVDAWDALTSDRHYRSRPPSEEAREHVIRGSGTKFDLDIVRLVVSRLPECEEAPAVPGA